MDLATIFAKELFKRGKLKDVDVSDENNACSIKVDVTINNAIHKYLLMFKNETHNHPTEIEPFGGASTCLGGAIRDPLSGRTYVYQAMRVTGSADPTTSITKTIPNKLPQRTITLGATRGYSSYGNQIGLATGQVNEVYHPGYVAKHMEVGAVVGAAPITNVVRKKPIKGDVIILLGGRTGKDGIGGATGSSKSHNNKSLHEMGAEVQKGNPICERKIQRLFMRADVTRLIKKCNDFGAGGASVAIGELCSGVDINLDLIPKKYLGLNGTELAISESQERMAVVVSNNDVNTFIDLANQENLEATVVAKVMDTNRLRMYWNQTKIVDLSRDFLNTNGALQHANIKILPITKNKLSNVSDKQNIKVS
jgi:phosphoribosylformylglycinamidine synthase